MWETTDIIAEYKESKKLFTLMEIIELLKEISPLGFWGSTAMLISPKPPFLLHLSRHSNGGTYDTDLGWS